jgi:CRP/FNR family nitrogen fixation transcriptional regulator
MFEQFASSRPGKFPSQPHVVSSLIARSGELDALDALEQLGTQRRFAPGTSIYAEGDRADCWFKVVSGTVRICKQMMDGRRQITEFFHAGEYFGLDDASERAFTAEAIGSVILMRFNCAATERLIDQRPELARRIRSMTLRNLAQAQARLITLGRMTASERVASFLLDLAERRNMPRVLEVTMTRNDIADYLGLTVETVCRMLSIFKRDGAIGIPNPHRIEICDREALVAGVETCVC